jgi:hypothetical protein
MYKTIKSRSKDNTNSSSAALLGGKVKTMPKPAKRQAKERPALFHYLANLL